MPDDASPLPPFTRVVRVVQTGSTNTDLREAVTAEPGAWPHLSVLVAETQDAGRGRAGRSWDTAPGTALTASVLLRPRVPPGRLPWLTLLAGLAVQRATAELTGVRTGLKWPNDVLVLDVGEEVDGWGTDRKVAGILAEALPAADSHDAGPHAAGPHAAGPHAAGPHAGAGHAGSLAVVLGIGVNVAQTRDQLPVPWATSLRLAADARVTTPGAEELLSAVGRHLADLLRRWEAAAGDAGAAGLAEDVARVCVTLGRSVRAELPGGIEVTGTATALDNDGHLLLRTPEGTERTVRAGDVRHVRAG
ncbi:biotin--[acetyl-CoA-carboxylase] ligase [Georgenia yuyongxinii]|uniref:biotin--[biotin carboxyl-carrier protein] ligase n=1 Tax=Georgenia yuyongxinii TaxID=2589797 RepID=A0A5B8C7X9_9MICO|nr:biotin--[acetyl-CoA-carboxylase] ligase [Georgenia yuyongxinii]QDC24036.1 biotin--[acetyl-CoA-carboxylase] ligase [Georgenia yuyongxinii]